jgi:hypothetical protein
MQNFWIDYTIPGDDIASSVPVFVDPVGAKFSDGAYDVFEYYYDANDEESSRMEEWENIVLTIIAPKLATMEDGAQLGFNINSDHWIFERNDNRDRFGNE